MLEQLYKAYRDTMLYTAQNILHDHALAEDAVSESIIKLSRHMEKFQDIFSHQTKCYVVKTVKTVSYDMYNKRTRLKEDEEDINISDVNIDVWADMVRKEGFEELKKIIDTLPDHLKDVLMLRASGYSHDEIAQALNITVSNSKKRLSRGRARIKKSIGRRP